jgi:hypothetical protein
VARRRRRRFDPIRSIGLLGGFGSIADGFATLGEGMGDLMGVDVDDPDDGSGRWLYKKKPLHPCVLPFFTDASVGDMWQCGECGSQWVVVSDVGGKVKMERIQAPPVWHQGQTTGTGGYGYTYTTGPYWYSSETRTERRGDPENP